MIQVLPHVDGGDSSTRRRRGPGMTSCLHSRRFVPHCGLVYLVVTLTCSIQYLFILAPYATNDHWWPHFNTSATQTFLADALNPQLFLGTRGPVDLLALTVAKSYGVEPTYGDMRAPAGRQIVLNNVPFSTVIATIRNNGVAENVRVMAQYCWVDLDRRFEMAHTLARQRRCATSMARNAAVVLETLLRNMDMDALMASEYGSAFNFSVLDAVRLESVAWVDATLQHEWASVPNECAVWASAGYTEWRIQLQNVFQEGMAETITIVNAIGMRQTFHINNMPFAPRSLAGWTTVLAFQGFWNDLFGCVDLGCSLVRTAPNSIDAINASWDMSMSGLMNSVGVTLVRSRIGPLASIDIELVPIPPALASFYKAFQAEVNAAIRAGDGASMRYLAEAGGRVQLAPWSTADYCFYGGNPMCLQGNAMGYSQPSFGYYDDCASQVPDEVVLTPVGIWFAWEALGNSAVDFPKVCAFTESASKSGCMAALTAAAASHALLADSLPTTRRLQPAAAVAAAHLNISTMQMAMETAYGFKTALLVQPLVDPSSGWSFFGWIMMLEWMDGRREVFRFEGDVSHVVLMSALLEFKPLAQDPAQLPQQACQYVSHLNAYVTLVLVGVAIVACGFGIAVSTADSTQSICSGQWFHFNRVVGGVWVGRSLLCMRGLTALAILCTAPVVLVTTHGVSALEATPRSMLETAIVAGETTWLTYVCTDVFLPVMGGHRRARAALSALFVWVATLGWEWLYPWKVTASIDRVCTVLTFRQGVNCISGEIHIGSFSRLLCMVGLNALGAVCSHGLVAAFQRWRPPTSSQVGKDLTPNALLSAASVAFLDPVMASPTTATVHLDPIGCVLSGLLPLQWHRQLFSLTLWSAFADGSNANHLVRWKSSQLFAAPSLIGPSPATDIPSPYNKRCPSLLSALGLAYLVASVASSYSFLALSKQTMANDFWWVGFESPGTHAYVANWFNQYLQLATDLPRVVLNDPKYAAVIPINNATLTAIVAPSHYASLPHPGLSTLSNVIAGLRRMDGCALPWIHTAYCYVDFEQQWEMANSVARQRRCRGMATNGAVFLAAVLRNAHWPSLRACWGAALDVGIFTHLKESTRGVEWLAAVQTNALSVDDEAALWSTRHGIVQYTTAWQNFKRMGVVESFSIQNAFGVSYKLLLKKTNGTLQFRSQNSFQLYWSLASDLWAVAANSTVLSGRSLVRSSSAFAFANMSMEDALLENGTLVAPLTVGRALVQSTMGPFGSIDAKRLLPPKPLIDLYRDVTELLSTVLTSSSAIQTEFWGLYHTFSYSPVPRAWLSGRTIGSNFLCDMLPDAARTAYLPSFFSWKGSCGQGGTAESVSGTTLAILKAIMALGVESATPAWIDATAAVDRATIDTADQLTASTLFLRAHFDTDVLDAIQLSGGRAKASVREDVNLVFVQFLSMDGDVALSQVSVFAEVELELYAWLFLWEWVEGKREAVRFEGDVGAVATFSSIDGTLRSPTNPVDIPLNVANYLRAIAQYTSLVLLGVASLACGYIVLNSGHIEGRNMFSFNRVTGLVWIGRPLLVLRGVTALCLLSTANLQLIHPHVGLTSHLASASPFWITTVLSSGEMTWLVYVILDVCSAVTGQRTSRYGTLSSVLVAAASVVWTFVTPVEPLVNLFRECSVEAVDFQVVCHSGAIHIGRYERFWGLLCLTGGSCLVSYVILGRRPSSQAAQQTTWSRLLHAAATYHFYKRNWEFRGVYYMDKASAALNGLLSMEFRGALYLLDVKLWRAYVVPDLPPTSDRPRHFQYCLPLVKEEGGDVQRVDLTQGDE